MSAKFTMAGREAQLAVLCILLFLLTIVHGGEEIGVAVAEALRAVPSASSNGINMTSGTLDLVDLPETVADRPPRPATGWGFCTNLDKVGPAACVLETPTLSTKEGGVLLLRIQHKPLSSVTPQMMKWLFENLDNEYSYKVNKTTYSHSLFLRMHPVDHAYHASSTPTAEVGSIMDWIETPLYGCTQRGGNLTATAKKRPYACSNTARQGPVQTPAPANLDKLFKSKISTVVSKLDDSGYESYTQVSNSQLIIIGFTSWNVSSLQHTWELNSDGKLEVNTTLRLGLLKQGENDFYQADPGNQIAGMAVVTVNKVVTEVFTSTAQWTQKTVEWLGYAQAMHFVQEIQLLRRWLPATYKQYGPK